MRIGVDIRPLLDRPLSGVGEYTLQLLTALMRLPAEDHFVLFANSLRGPLVLPAAWPRDRYTVARYRLPNKMLNTAFWITGGPALSRLLGPLDLFFAPNHMFLPSLRHLPFVLTVHDLSYHHYPDLFSRRRQWWHRMVRPRRLIAAASHLIAVSSATATDLQRTFGVAPERITVVPSGVEARDITDAALAHVRIRYGLPRRFLFSLATLEPRKNLVTLLEAYTVLRRDSGYNGGLVVTGAPGWSHRRLAAALAEHPYRDDIRFLNYVSPHEKYCLYRLADVFLFLSLFEGFGFPPLEALVTGTPTVAGHHTSLTEVAGEGALLVDVYNVRDVAAATQALLTDPHLRAALLASSEMLRQRFSWERTARATREVFLTTHHHAHRH